MKDGKYIFGINSGRILTLYDNALIAHEDGIPAPRMAIVYPTYTCSFRCVGCEYASINKPTGPCLERKRLFSLLKELHDFGVRSVEFSGGGEPTLYPWIEQAILCARKLGLAVGMLTSGAGLRDSLIHTIVEELSYVRISLDGATAATYNAVRRPNGGTFPGIIQTLRTLVKERDAAQSHLLVDIKYLVGRDNAREIPRAVRLARDLGVDSIQFKALRGHEREIDAGDRPGINHVIVKLRNRYSDIAVLGGVDKLNIDTKCKLTPLQSTIDALGNVYLCSYFLHRRSRHLIGNIHENTFREIWTGDRHKRAISGIRPSECNRYDCRFIRYAGVLDPLINDQGGQVRFI